MIQRIVSFVFVLLSCGVSAQECRPLSCDCDSIPNLEWRTQCQIYLKQAPACEITNDQRNYCQVAGVEARSLPLVVAKLAPESVENLDQSLEKLKLLSWAVREENTTAVTMRERGDIKGALKKHKNEAKLRRQLHQLSVGVALHHQQQGNQGDAHELFKALWVRNANDADLSSEEARKLWVQASQNSADQNRGDQKALGLLAQRMLRNSALEYEMAADLARRDRRYSTARDYWRQSAQAIDELLNWKKAQGSKANVIAYYQQSAAARWYQSGLMSLMDEDTDAAIVAKDKSEQLWSGVSD